MVGVGAVAVGGLILWEVAEVGWFLAEKGVVGWVVS